MANKRETSQVTSQLRSRIDTNNRFGSVNLDEWLFEKLKIEKGFNVLDVGCGTGNHIMKIAEKFPEGNYYGIDISGDSISDAIEKSRQKGLKLKFICGDASDASRLQDKFFDVIMSVYALYYVKNPQHVLSVLKSKLRKNGKIAVMSPYKRNNDEWYDFLRKFMQIPKEVESVANSFMDKDVLPFARANFSKVQTFNFENRIAIPSFDDLKKYWVSNIYYKEEYDNNFERHALDFFSKNNEFVLTKKALLAIMY